MEKKTFLEFKLPISPVPASRPKVSRFAVYYPKKYENFRVTGYKLMQKVPKTLFKNKLYAYIEFYIPIAKSASKKTKDELHGTYCDLNYDIDNLQKAIFDLMNKHVYEDDRQLVCVTATKLWTKEKPYINVEIREC